MASRTSKVGATTYSYTSGAHELQQFGLEFLAGRINTSGASQWAGQGAGFIRARSHTMMGCYKGRDYRL